MKKYLIELTESEISIASIYLQGHHPYIPNKKREANIGKKIFKQLLKQIREGSKS